MKPLAKPWVIAAECAVLAAPCVAVARRWVQPGRLYDGVLRSRTA